MTRTEYWMARTRNALVSLLAPWVANRTLRAENERLCAVITDPLLTGINIGNGTIDIGLEGGPATLMAGMFLGMFEKHPDAKNYIECSFSSPSGPVMVTIVRPGGRTPTDMLKEVRRECEELRSRLPAPTPEEP